MTRFLRILLAALLISAASGVRAQTPTGAAKNDNSAPARAWRLGIALGYGERTNPLIVSQDIPVFADVDVAWFGKRWFFDNGDLGFAVVSNRSFAASLVARVNSDRVFFSNTHVRLVQVSIGGVPLPEPTELRVPDRSYAVELGIEALMGGDWGQMAASAFHDVSGTHDGFAVEFDYSYPWLGRQWVIEPNIGLRYKSKALADYFWGVRVEESNAALPSYTSGSAVNLQAGLRASYYLSTHLRLVTSINYEWLGDEIAASPLTREREVLGWFGGLAYEF